MGGNPRIPNLNDSYAKDVGDTETHELIQELIHDVLNIGMHQRELPQGRSAGFPRQSAQNSGLFNAAGPSHVPPVRNSYEDPRPRQKSSGRKQKSGE